MRAGTACLVGLVLAVVTGGCGTAPGGTSGVDAPPPATQGAEQVVPDIAEGVPQVSVRGADEAVDLRPWTFCWTSGCADGAPPDDLADLGAPPELVVTFPEPGWSFEAIFSPADQPCGRRQVVPVERIGEQEHLVRPAGPAGVYDVDLFGRGPEGDVVVTARWSTPVDGPMPVPTASVAVLAEHDGLVDSYGVELLLDDLAETPEQVAATVTVTSSEGAAVSFEATRMAGECQEEGWVLFDGPDEPGAEAAALGTPPFTYDVDLTIDGQSHAATATWPDDVLPDYAPSVSLDFDPPLPALTP